METRKRASAGRSAAEQSLFSGLLEAAPDGMVIVDEHGTIVLVNAQTERLFGYARAELVGQRVEMLVPGRFAGGHEAFRTGYAHEPRTRPMGRAGELFARRKDGTEFPVEISLAPLETGDGLLVSAAVRDITDRLGLQAAANRARDEFFASVSHELRTPLTSMIGYAELMEEIDDLPDQARQFLEVISRSAQRELRLVNDLLTLVHLESDGLTMDRASLDIVQVVEECLSRVQPVAAEHGLTVTMVRPSETLSVDGDAGRLVQVVDNLLSNAVKVTPSGGSIVVRVGLSGDAVTLDVTDDGPGVSAPDLARLFERLFRTGDAVERGIPGAGLGLAIARGIVEAHDGTLECTSTIGVGSTFRMRLPHVTTKG